jgi:XTP/dITP diphosphohydrolase
LKLVIASNNNKKIAEMRRILSLLDISVITPADAGCAHLSPEETGSTFSENAQIKAAEFCRYTDLPSIADDSGLCVDALGGEPGVYSARYSGEEGAGADEANIDKLLQSLEGVPKERRTARFVSAICCVFPNGDTVTAEGVCEGYIGFMREGNGGFGYDPVFMVESGKSFALLSDAEKDSVSHRGKALRLFSDKIAQYLKK